ncbi:MAG: type II secretion system F family protein, partial [Candidatus Pacebacteria bacterium]|nr:type II secretion system F family protein [Candidatus Paceibacterota bacterium]
AKNARNLRYRAAFDSIRVDVIRGETVAAALKRRQRLFPSVCVEMINAGEQTGNLESSFAYIAELYEEQVEDIARNLTILIEPVLMVVMGITVGFIALSIIAPIYGITNQFNV